MIPTTEETVSRCRSGTRSKTAGTMTRIGDAGKETAYLVLWWRADTPHVTRFHDEGEAESAAIVRDGVVIELRGREMETPRVVDYYRGDRPREPVPTDEGDAENRPDHPESFETDPFVNRRPTRPKEPI